MHNNQLCKWTMTHTHRELLKINQVPILSWKMWHLAREQNLRQTWNLEFTLGKPINWPFLDVLVLWASDPWPSMTDWSSSWSPWPRPTLWGMRLTHHPSCAQSNLLGTFHRKASKSLYLQAGTMHILGLRMVWIIAVHREEREALECSQGLISPFTVGRGGARHGYIRSDAPRGVRNRPRLSWSGWSMCWVTCNCNPGGELQNRWYCGYCHCLLS